MSKIYFKELLRKHLNGESSESEKKTIEKWLQLLDNGEKKNFSSSTINEIEEELWQKIQTKTGLKEQQKPQLKVNRNWIYWSAAASVILIVGVWLFNGKTGLSSIPQISTILSNGLEKQSNNTSSEMKVQLSDGSVVLLQANSSIEYSKNFVGNRREVFLKGNAFFKVSKNPEKPFLVYTNDLITKVLGTSFWIKTDGSNKVEVSVVTGKVTVFKNDKNEDYISDKVKSGVILTPNQSVLYIADNELFTTKLVENPVLIQSEEIAVEKHNFVFDETAISEVFSVLENAYGIEIILENEKIKTCPFTADLTNKPLYTQLDLLCETMHLSYEIRGTKILISGKGCE